MALSELRPLLQQLLVLAAETFGVVVTFWVVGYGAGIGGGLQSSVVGLVPTNGPGFSAIGILDQSKSLSRWSEY